MANIIEAILGDVTFRTDDHSAIGGTFAANYAEHGLIEGKPALQFVGDECDEITWSLTFHASFCTPEAEMLKLRAAVAKHEPLPLVFSNGDYKGLFVPVSVRETTHQLMPDGGLLWQAAELTLREFVRPVVVGEEKSRQPAAAAEKTGANGKTTPPSNAVRRDPAPRSAAFGNTRNAR